MSYSFPNVGRQRLAQVKAAQLRALGPKLNTVIRKQGGLVVMCAKNRTVCRVAKLPDGLLFMPNGKAWETKTIDGQKLTGWVQMPPYWLEDSGPDEVVRCRCDCCADPHSELTVDRLIRAVETGERTIRLAVVS